MKILEVNKAYYPHIGGIESLVKQYSEGFGDRADVEVLACRDDFGKSIRQKTNGVKVLKCGSLGTLFKCPISPSFILMLSCSTASFTDWQTMAVRSSSSLMIGVLKP